MRIYEYDYVFRGANNNLRVSTSQEHGSSHAYKKKFKDFQGL